MCRRKPLKFIYSEKATLLLTGTTRLRLPVADRLAGENIQKRHGKFPLSVSSESENESLQNWVPRAVYDCPLGGRRKYQRSCVLNDPVPQGI